MRSLPQHLCDRAEVLQRSHSLNVVAEILKLHPSAVYRMRDRNWKEALGRRHYRPVPSDFAIQAKYMSTRELMVHYRASARAVSRWLKECPTRPHFKPGIKREFRL